MLKSKVRNSEKFVMKIQEKLMMSIVPKPRGYRMLFKFWSLFIGSKFTLKHLKEYKRAVKYVGDIVFIILPSNN